MFLPGALRDLVGGVASTVEEEIRRLRYLGPLRSYPPRYLAFSQHHDPNWFAGGGYAWDVVRTREDIRRRVNDWLGDAARLKTPYELMVRELLPAGAIAAELPPKVAKALHDLAASLLGRLHGETQPDLGALASELAERLAEIGPGEPGETIPQIEDIVTATTDSEALAERWARELVEARAEALQDLVLIDKRTGTPVSHRDVGIGVSQAGLGLCLQWPVGGHRAARDTSASCAAGRARRRLCPIRPRRAGQRLPDRDSQRAPDSAHPASSSRDHGR